jgi:ABC-2 type transport system ATP-binding protein
MISFEVKCSHVQQHLVDGDLSIGFRKLIDCVFDTQNRDLYQKVIDYMENTDGENESTKHQDWMQNMLNLLSKIQIKQTFDTKSSLLHAEKISKSYGRSNFSLRDVDIKIVPGDVWGLVGENGNGKTTLLRILANDLSHDSGECFYQTDGKVSAYDLRSQLAYIPQRTPTWYGSVKSNLKFTAAHYGIKGAENEQIVLMYMIRFGLWKYRNHQWSELSSGFKMRFELARTFLRKPRILLLDEPLANLDVLAQQVILEDLKHMSLSLANPIGIILSSQQLYEVEKISDKVLFLKNGKPTYLNHANEQVENQHTVLEIDTDAKRESIEKALHEFSLVSLQFNGGTYVVEVKGNDQMNRILLALVQADIEMKYVRDISRSTRRLFVS